MIWGKRARRAQEAAEAEHKLAAEHKAIRERLLRTVERTAEYAADLQSEVQTWREDREDET